MVIDIPEDRIIPEDGSIHRSERLEYPHLEYCMMSETHILRSAIGDESSSILVE